MLNLVVRAKHLSLLRALRALARRVIAQASAPLRLTRARSERAPLRMLCAPPFSTPLIGDPSVPHRWRDELRQHECRPVGIVRHDFRQVAEEDRVLDDAELRVHVQLPVAATCDRRKQEFLMPCELPLERGEQCWPSRNRIMPIPLAEERNDGWIEYEIVRCRVRRQ